MLSMPWEESSKKRKMELQEMWESSEKNKLELQEKSQQIRAATLKAVNEVSNDKSGWLPATVWFCLLISGPNPPIARVLPYDVLTSLLLFLTEENIPELQVEAANALIHIGSRTCDGADPLQPMYSVQYTIQCLLHTRDDEVLLHACYSLAVLSGCENVKITELIRASHVEDRLLQLILISDKMMVAAALRTLGNIMEGDANLIDCMMIRHGDVLLPELRRRLYDELMDVRKEACWMISYITAGSEHGKQGVHEHDLIKPLVRLIRYDKLVVMVAAVHAISNATRGATPKQTRSIVSSGCIDVFCNLFCCRNSAIFNIVLQGIEAILEVGENEKRNSSDVNQYAEHIGRIEGWLFLEMSATHYEKKLHKRICHVLAKYGPNPSCHKSHMASCYSSDDDM